MLSMHYVVHVVARHIRPTDQGPEFGATQFQFFIRSFKQKLRFPDVRCTVGASQLLVTCARHEADSSCLCMHRDHGATRIAMLIHHHATMSRVSSHLRVATGASIEDPVHPWVVRACSDARKP